MEKRLPEDTQTFYGLYRNVVPTRFTASRTRNSFFYRIKMAFRGFWNAFKELA